MDDKMQLQFRIDLSDTSRPIVMVDDEDLDYMTADRFYRRSGLANPFVRFSDGEQFLAYLAEVKQGRAALPALVLMDVNMPRMTGFEVIEQMRADDFFQDVPVVSMLTSSSDFRDQDKAKTVGAQSYLVKPFDPRAYSTFFQSLGIAA